MQRTKYEYSEEVEKDLKKFEEYLRTKGYALDTIRQTRNYAGVYLEWLNEEELALSEVDYKTLMTFIFQLKIKKSTNQINRILLAIRHYYNSLELENNPASGIHIRGTRRSVLNDIIRFADLEELHATYQLLDDRDKRNKVILGILIYQGIRTRELHQLEPNHIDLKKGKVYIPGSKQSNGRILELQSAQLLELQEYLLMIRPRMLTNIEACKSGRKPDKIDPKIGDKLFFSENGNADIKPSLHHLFRSVKKRYPKIVSGKIIRSTVIAEWLKTKDVRIVQYMAGHKWVSSTERYIVYNLQELKDALKKHHPMK